MSDVTVDSVAWQAIGADVPDWIMPLRGPAPGAPLFMVHPVGGSTLGYLPLVRALHERPCFGVEARGLHGPDEDHSLAAATHAYLAAVRRIQPAGPYLLAGWSLGAALAFEIACRLRERGAAVALLAMVDADPDWTLGQAPDEPGLLVEFVRDLARLQGRKVPPELLAGIAAPAGGEERVDRTVRRLRAAELVPAGAEPDIRRRIRVFTTMARAFGAYRPEPTDVTVTLFSSRAGAERQAAAWRRLARSGVVQHVLDADHYGLLCPPHVQEIAAVIDAALDGPGARSAAV